MVRTIFNIKTAGVIIFCVVVVVAGVWLRVDRMLFVEDHYVIPDLNRDLLVGQHIAEYKEFILIGPDSTSGLPLYNSSLFFILTALTGIVFSFTTLGINIGNLIYQVLSVGLIFGTTKNLFNTRAAIVAATMMLLFDIFINQSRFFWQPHLMQVVYMTSLFALSLGYAKKDKRYLYLSIFLFAASIGTHYPPILVAPVFGAAVWIVLFHQRAGILSYIATGLFGIASMAVVFSTAIFYKFVAPQSTVLQHVQQPDLSIGYYVVTFFRRTEYFVSYYLPKADTILLQYAACAVLIAGCAWYFYNVRSSSTKYVFAVLLAAVVAVLFGVTVTYFPYESFVAYPLRYYTAAFVPLTILIAAVLAELWAKPTVVRRTVALIAFGGILIFGGSYFGEQPVHPLAPSQHSLTQFLFNDKSSVQQINAAMLDVIQRRGIMHQFDVVTFDGRDAFFVNDRADDIIWFPLEQMIGKQLVTLDEESLRSYRPIDKTKYLLVRCREVTQERCLYLIRYNLPQPYENYKVIVEQLTSSPDPAYLVKP